MLNIYIDADACPVKDEVLRVAYRHDLEVYIVSNGWWCQPVGEKVHRIMVKAGFDAADDWIVDHVDTDDIVITSDILLASRCIKKGAEVIRPNGKPLSNDTIGMALAMRDLSAHLREAGEITGHTASFTKQDRSRFLQVLEETVQRMKRKKL